MRKRIIMLAAAILSVTASGCFSNSGTDDTIVTTSETQAASETETEKEETTQTEKETTEAETEDSEEESQSETETETTLETEAPAEDNAEETSVPDEANETEKVTEATTKAKPAETKAPKETTAAKAAVTSAPKETTAPPQTTTAVVTTTAAATVTQAETSAPKQTEKAKKTETEAFSERILTDLPDIQYWEADSPTVKAVKKYIQSVTDYRKSGYINESDRICVIDLDTALMGRSAGLTIDMLIWRSLEDSTFDTPPDMRTAAERVRDAMGSGEINDRAVAELKKYYSTAYDGLTKKEYQEIVRRFGADSYPGFTGLTVEKAFYKPIISIMKYLDACGFKIYVVSTWDKLTVQTLTENTLNIPAENIIAPEVFKVTDKGTIRYDDSVGKFNKLKALKKQVSKVPVITFAGGESFDIAEYVKSNDKYKTASFMVLHDDPQREHGDPKESDKMKGECEEKGLAVISIKDEFDTVYGYGVQMLVDTRNDMGFMRDGREIVP